MKIVYKIVLVFFILLNLSSFSFTHARTQITDWYIKDFQSDLIINENSTIEITEKITADCGDLVGKHGIYRILPTRVYNGNDYLDMPVDLISITDFQDNPVRYETIINKTNHTITWKIGDAYKEVQGVNYYKIKYLVKDVISFKNPNFDIFYWNLVGNFWLIDIDNFTATLTYPGKIDQKNSIQKFYFGTYAQEQEISFGEWQNNTYKVSYNKTIKPGEGITVLTHVPKNIFYPRPLTFWEKYSFYFQFLSFLIPIFIYWLAYSLWNKYGRDPKLNKTIVPEFEIPGSLDPMSLDVFINSGKLPTKSISAGIVNLAVKGFLKIELITKKNYLLTKIEKNSASLSDGEKLLIEKLFEAKKEIKTEDLTNKFYTHISEIQAKIEENLKSQGLIENKGMWVAVLFIIFTVIILPLAFIAFTSSVILALSLLMSVIILIVFTVLMPRRPLKGVEFLYKVKGFQLYIQTAEKYRQKFFEKENIFEKYLPYAMVFGLTKEWIKKFDTIYQEEYHKSFMSTYIPVWLIAGSSGQFNIDNFASNINSLSNNMAATLASSPSGSGGGGFSGGGGSSGGGGGGGGGGGW